MSLPCGPQGPSGTDETVPSREGSSSEGEYFIAYEMQADSCGLRTVEIERLDGLLDVGPQFVPRVALGKDALGQTLRTKATVRFLRYLEHDFAHTLNLP